MKTNEMISQLKEVEKELVTKLNSVRQTISVFEGVEPIKNTKVIENTSPVDSKYLKLEGQIISILKESNKPLTINQLTKKINRLPGKKRETNSVAAYAYLLVKRDKLARVKNKVFEYSVK